MVDVINEVRRDRLLDVAAGVTFWLLLSLPAAMLAAVASASFLGPDAANALQNAVVGLVETALSTESEEVRSTVEDLFVERTGLLSASIAVAIFTIARGFGGLLRALDTAYSVIDRRSFLSTRVLAVGLALGTIITMVGSIAGWLALRTIGVPAWVGSVGAMVILIGWAATVYHVGPHQRTPWYYDLPGATFTAVGWLAMTIGFGWYVQLAGTGNQVVGTLGGLLLGFTWLWLVSLVLLLGAEINGLIARRRDVVRAPGRITREIIIAGRTRISSRRHDGDGYDGNGHDNRHERGERASA